MIPCDRVSSHTYPAQVHHERPEVGALESFEVLVTQGSAPTIAVLHIGFGLEEIECLGLLLVCEFLLLGGETSDPSESSKGYCLRSMRKRNDGRRLLNPFDGQNGFLGNLKVKQLIKAMH